jgi:selenocysteine lyase/cysteine desulfurase
MSTLRAAQELFAPAPGYFNTASNGVPPLASVAALREALDDWQHGRSDAANEHYFDAVTRGRAAFGRLVGVDADQVAIGGSVSPLVGLAAAALPRGSEVLVAQGDFTAVQYPFVARAELTVRAVPLEAIVAEVRPETAIVAVSAVQSANGAIVDLDALAATCRAHGAATLIDATQAAGWLPLDATAFDMVVCGVYTWLLSPNGVALMTVSPEWLDRLVPHSAGWYAGDDIWNSIYALPMQLAKTARRLDTTPAWMSWPATAHAIELLESVGVETIRAHNVRLTDRLCAAVGRPPCGSAIASLTLDGAAQRRLAAAGIATAVRDGKVRFSCHLYTTDADIDLALNAIEGS